MVSGRNLNIKGGRGGEEGKKKKKTHLGKFALLAPMAQRSMMPNLWLCMSFINCLRDWQKGTEKTTTTTIFTQEHSWRER